MREQIRRRAGAYFESRNPGAWVFGADGRLRQGVADAPELVGRLIVVDPASRRKLRVIALEHLDSEPLIRALAHETNEMFEWLERLSELAPDDAAESRRVPSDLPFARTVTLFTEREPRARQLVVDAFEEEGLPVSFVVDEPEAASLLA